MASYLEEFVSYGSDFEVLDAETAERSVVVRNIPEEAREQDIIIHFQKRKNGGGDIERLHILEDTTTAVVTFDSEENTRSVLAMPQHLLDSLLELTPYTSVLPEKLPQVFCRVTARIEPDACGVSPRVLQSILKRVEEEMTNLKHHEASGWFIVSGTFEEIRKYRELLQTFLAKEGSRQLGDEKRSEIENSNESLEVVPKFMKLLQRAYKERLDGVESGCLVELAWHEGSNKVEIKRSPGCRETQYKEGVDKFINLYQQLYPEMAQEDVELPVNDDDCIKKAANQIMDQLPVFIERRQDKWSAYGEKSVVSRAVRRLKEELGLNADNGRRSRRKYNAQGNTPPNQDRHQQPSPHSRREYSAPHGPLQRVLSNGVTISVLKGDITSQQVDAIVNAANEDLEHGGGVAGAIVRRGGSQIQEESRGLVQNWGRVRVGNAVCTTAGNLPCKVVIHAVGPRWDNSKETSTLLRLACISSLRCAASLGMTSIALPAISSGIFGMPKELCAKTMFEAVHEFSNSVDCMLSSLRDVRFVNIDDETVAVFKKEFLDRGESGTGGGSNQHPNAAAPEDSRQDNLSTVNINKELSFKPANRAAANVSGGDKPGHAKRVNVEEENNQGRNPKTLIPGGHSASGNDAPLNLEEHSRLEPDVEDEKNKRSLPGREDSRYTKRTSNAEFCKEQENNSKISQGIGRGYTTFARANYQAPTPPATKRFESISSSTDSRAQEGTLATAKKAETSKSGDSKDAATRTDSSKPGSKHKTAAGRGRVQASNQESVRHPPGLTSPTEDKRLVEQLKHGPSTTKSTEVAHDENRASELNGQESNPMGPSSTGGEIHRDLTTVTASPSSAENTAVHNHKPPVEDTTKAAEELHNQHADDSRGGSHQPHKGDRASSNNVPQNSEEDDHTSTGGLRSEDNISDRDDSDRSKGTALVDGDREDGGTNFKDIEPSYTVLPRSPGSENDESLITLANAASTPLPEDTEGIDELDLPGQSEEEILPGANTDDPPPLEDATNPEHNELLNPQSKTTNETSGTSKGSNDGRADLPKMGTTEMAPSSAGGRETISPDENTSRCYICFEPYKQDPKELPNCGHKFCGGCIEKELRTRSDCPKCALQSTHRAVPDQPLGYMSWKVEEDSLPGFKDCGTIVISYHIPDGTQGGEHPNPGKPYVGVARTAYIPDSEEGREVLTLLKQAFDTRLVFSLNKRPTEEDKNLVIWNIIHHKTRRHSEGSTNNGYPDDGYLSRVKQELAALGITKPM